VWVSYAAHPNRASNAPIVVHHAGGTSWHTIDQRQPAAIGGLYVSLGVYEFTAEKEAAVVISREGADGIVTADAVRFIPVDGVAGGDEAGGAFESRQWAALSEQLQRVDGEIATLAAAIGELKKNGPPPPPMAMAVRDADRPADTPIRLRGVADSHGEKVPRGFLSAVHTAVRPSISAQSSGRLELAQWITQADHPLTARVMVNRIWANLLGEGLVRTVDNFGTRGEPPTHPQLLDHLALQFVDDGWSVKKMVRRIVLSRTYQLASDIPQSAITNPQSFDPENRLLWRAHRKRLPAEALRDAMLAVSGELDGAMGGRTIEGKVETEFDYHLTHRSVRRGVYLPVFRNSLPDLFEVFDFAEPNLVCGRRNASTLPTQALYMLNSPFVMDRARHAAASLLADGSLDEPQRLELAYVQALSRPPSPAERKLAMEFLAREQAAGVEPLEAWAGVYQALLGCVDFRYLH